MSLSSESLTTLVLVRHGETYQNASMFKQLGVRIDPLSEVHFTAPEGRDSEDMNPRGFVQAQHLAARLATMDFAAVYASTARRVRETLDPALEAMHKAGKFEMRNVVYTDDLLEVRLSDLHAVAPDLDPGMENYWRHWAERFNAAKKAWTDAGNHPGDFRVGACETDNEVGHRCRKVLAAILARHSGQSVLVAAHGMFNTRLLCCINGWDRWVIQQDNCCINILKCTHDGLAAARHDPLINDTSHLPPSLVAVSSPSK